MTRLHRRQRGFTLIELLIVIAIIGIIAAILIPNFLDSLQKAKQKRSMGDIRDVGTAWFAWLTDQYGGTAAAGAPAAEGTYTLPSDSYTHENLKADLVPTYIQELPETDAWGHNVQFCRATNVLTAPSVMSISSPGRDGGAPEVTCGQPAEVGGFDPTTYDEDIIWADGYFVRYPHKVGTDEGAPAGS